MATLAPVTATHAFDERRLADYLRACGLPEFAGGLTALQTASIAAALPISVILIFMAWGLLKSLSEDSSAVAAPDRAGEAAAPAGPG